MAYRFSRALLTDARKRAGHTRESLAKAADISVYTLCAWEYGHRTPNAELLVAVAKVLGISTEDLFEGSVYADADGSYRSQAGTE